jgi:protein involved in polysaccharide export with SLBB domain
MRTIKFIAVASFVALMCVAPNLRAQEVPSINRASQYLLGDRDELLIKVNILGFVAKPGQYLVPRNTDLISLIAFAGGPKEGGKLSEVRIVRGTILENGGNGHSTNGHSRDGNMMQVNVKDFMEKGDTSKIPPLLAGDTIIIPQSMGNKFKTVMGFSSIVGIIAAGASIAIIIDRVAQ